MALLCEDKVSQAEIGRRLGICKSTVSRELRRNRSVDGYQPCGSAEAQHQPPQGCRQTPDT
ncbi:hypothetical protein EWM60_19895 [Candidatus Erwinia dacicola]|nr:hypothetical protein [Candidatus Erwinia dacicola]